MKFKQLITNCKCEIKSLLTHVRGEEITHLIVTKDNNKIKCYESIELFSDETKFIAAKCLIGKKQHIITINDDNINYITEKYNDDIWNQIYNIGSVNLNEKNEDYTIYG